MKFLLDWKYASLWIVLTVCGLPAFAQGYEIRLTINNGNEMMLLGHYFANSSMFRDDSCQLDKSGKGVFKGKEKLERGLYCVIWNKRTATGVEQRKLFDFIVGDEQKFEITADTTDLVNKISSKGSKENEVFFAFQRFNMQKGLRFQELRQSYESAADSKKPEIRTELQALNQERLEYLQKTIDDNQGLFVVKFFKTLIPVDSKLPDYPRDDAGNITDSTYLYRWYRAHFFDNLNIYDPEMLRTPFYEEKLMEYFGKVIPQHPDTINLEADKILAKAQADPAVFRCVLVTLFNFYTKSQIMVHENIWVHLADKWYKHASWTSPDYLEKLAKEVDKRKTNLIGSYAPPMDMLMVLPPDHFKAAALDTAIKNDLHAGVPINDFRKSLKGKFTAILFWDISCSHCRKTIQDLYAEYEKLKEKGLTVITVQTVNTKDAKGKWIDFVNEHQMFGWTNAWSPYSVKFRTAYDISTTPQLFLLNENEEIIGKRLTPEQLELFLK
ncbi:hypothetical protein FACS189430_08010 [Bacteroidia bacterium]|nr:hypothetical protein FACS189430_08010 [Bacteroidia bacterium]